jgi:hypothetical protein
MKLRGRQADLWVRNRLMVAGEKTVREASEFERI